MSIRFILLSLKFNGKKVILLMVLMIKKKYNCWQYETEYAHIIGILLILNSRLNTDVFGEVS